MILQPLCWLLPASNIKNRLLRRFGHGIGRDARIGPSIVLGVGHFDIGDNALISPGNVFRGLSLIVLGKYAMVGSWNWISAASPFQELDPRAGTLYVGTAARLGSRCYFDCSGTIIVKAFSLVGGHRCFLQSHQPDYETSRQTVGRITVGHHSMVASGATMLMGAVLPDRSLLGANSTMMRQRSDEPKPGLYAGTPAVWKRDTTGEFFERNTRTMHEQAIVDVMGIQPDDLALEDAAVIADE